MRLARLWLIAWFGAAAIATWIAHWSALPELRLSHTLHAPDFSHWMGFDPFGNDLAVTLLEAALKSAAFSAIAVAATVVLGTAVGSAIALTSDRVRFLLLRGLDSFLAFPALLLALALATVRGPGWGTLLASLLIGVLPSFVRLIYVSSREILSEPFIEAAQSLGASSPRILLRHLIPMLGPVIAVKIPILFAQALTAEATLSFLGIGAPIGHETWGSLLATGKDYLFEAPHIALAAGIPLTLTILSLQALSRSSVSASN